MVFQDAPAQEVAAEHPISFVKKDQLLGSNYSAAMSTHSKVKIPNSIGEDQKLAEADQRLNIVGPRHRLSGAARRRFKKVRNFRMPRPGSKLVNLRCLLKTSDHALMISCRLT